MATFSQSNHSLSVNDAFTTLTVTPTGDGSPQHFDLQGGGQTLKLVGANYEIGAGTLGSNATLTTYDPDGTVGRTNVSPFRFTAGGGHIGTIDLRDAGKVKEYEFDLGRCNLSFEHVGNDEVKVLSEATISGEDFDDYCTTTEYDA